jgi:phosphocarrier protein HPr
MIRTTTTINNKLGLHARASAKLTKLAGSYPCDIWVSRGERRVNAKSIMGVMMLAAGIGSEVTVETSGERDGRPAGADRGPVWRGGMKTRRARDPRSGIDQSFHSRAGRLVRLADGLRRRRLA